MPQGQILLPFSGASTGGEKTKSESVTILPGQIGSTFTLSDAFSPIAVLRNGTDDPNYTFNTHTWTFTNPLTEEERLTFIYNKV